MVGFKGFFFVRGHSVCAYPWIGMCYRKVADVANDTAKVRQIRIGLIFFEAGFTWIW